VTSCIRTTEGSIGSKLPPMYALHERLSEWWRGLPAELCLTPDNIPRVEKCELSNLLLINVVYHQSLCTLHASIVPLFCWGEAVKEEDGWLVARQLSAQVAYEHAYATSDLLKAVMAINGLSVAPSFTCYAAYCGCAIQIPFMWSSNISVRERASTNVRANMEIIKHMSPYWKYAALLVCFHTIEIPS
jgi:hypothetical protein